MHLRRFVLITAALGAAGLAISATVQHSTQEPPAAHAPAANSADKESPKGASSERAATLKSRHEKAPSTPAAKSNSHANAAQAQEGKSANAHAASESSAGVESLWNELMAGNQRFVAGKPSDKSLVESRKRLASGQHPKAIVLACADSRVAPELIFDQGLGELFVVRVAGNVADAAALGSIEYAVEHLHCGVIVVVGHEKCGAVAAAASGVEMPTNNLNALVQRITPSIEPLRLCADGDQLVQMGVRMNAHGSACALIEESPIVEHALESGELAILAAVYDLESGNVRRLPATPCVQAHAR